MGLLKGFAARMANAWHAHGPPRSLSLPVRVELVLAQEIANNGWASMDSGPAPRVLDRQGTAQWPEPTAPGRVCLVTDLRISRIQLIRLTE